MNASPRARLAPIVLAPLALVAVAYQQVPTTTTTQTLDVTAPRHTETATAPLTDILRPTVHPADVAAREAGFAADRARMDQWQVDGTKALADHDAKVAAEEAAAKAARAVRPTNHEHISPRAGGNTGGGSIPSGCNAPGPPPPDYIKQRESSGDYRLNDPNGHYGAWQFSPETWRSVGGSGNPANASPSEQDCRAAVLWNNGAGRSNWAATA